MFLDLIIPYRVFLRWLLSIDRSRLGNFYPLLIASYERYEDGEFGKKEFVKILERIETFIFRIYSVKQRPAHTARIPFYKLARRVHKKEVKGGLEVGGKPFVLSKTGADEILSEIEEQIHSRCDDETLGSILSRKDLFKYYGSVRKSELRYLLYFYEKALEKEFEGLTPPLLPFVKNTWQNTPSGEEVTIEHISPQSDAQLNFTKEERKAHESYKDKLGNQAYMTGPWNKEQQDRPVAKKISAYRRSKIRMPNSVARIVER